MVWSAFVDPCADIDHALNPRPVCAGEPDKGLAMASPPVTASCYRVAQALAIDWCEQFERLAVLETIDIVNRRSQG